LVTAQGAAGYVEVNGLSEDLLDRIDDARLSPEQWTALFRVAVGDDLPAMLGTYRVEAGALRFTPAFPFDPGRAYQARFDPAAVPSLAAAAPVLTAEIARPAGPTHPSTTVTRIYPSGGEVPENLLRMYIEFSAPMGRRTGIEYLRLVDDAGQTVEAPFLPLDYEFWSPDRRRFTVFFDPGRVKDGILPNREMGRALVAGRSYTLIVSSEWRDDHGLPLIHEFRHQMKVRAAQAAPLDTSTWRVTAPRAGGHGPVIVTFPAALDHGLLTRALGVQQGGKPVEGDIAIEPGERRWLFTPTAPWRPGRYDLLALSILEDPAGNQIGRAFEVDNFDTVDRSPEPRTMLVPFTVVSAPTE
jgi:hypothetical protein